MKRLGAAIAAFALAALWIACSGDTPSSPVEKRCASSDECPDPYNFYCGEATCTDGICGVRFSQESNSQRRGDCQVNTCDAEGNLTTVADPRDIYEGIDPCVVYSCDGDQRLTTVYREAPAPSGSAFCDKNAALVDCLTTEDCTDPSFICSFQKKCVPASCNNGVFDPSLGELGRDCGGPCELCNVGFPCVNDGDCRTNVCGPDKTCIGYSCNDGRKTGSETDVDCGTHECGPCKDGEGCLIEEDCESLVCWAGLCQPPTCFDDIHNGEETGRDCGGPDCHPC